MFPLSKVGNADLLSRHSHSNLVHSLQGIAEKDFTMNSPPPEPSGHVSIGDKHKNTPSRNVVPTTPTKQKPLSHRQLPTPSYSPQAGGLVVTWDTKFGGIKRRLAFTKDGPVPCPVEGLPKPDVAASVAGSPAIPQPANHNSHGSSGEPTRPYSIIQRNRDLDSVQGWLSSSATEEQHRQRAKAVIAAIFQGSSNNSMGKRKRRTKRPERDDDCSSDSDLYSESESDTENDNDDAIVHEGVTIMREQPLAKRRKHGIWTPSAVPNDDLALPAPKIGEVGIQNADDLKIITEFRKTHNPVLASIQTGKVVLPYCGGAAPGPRGRFWHNYDQQQKQDESGDQKEQSGIMETSALLHEPEADEEMSDAPILSSGIKDTTITEISDDDDDDDKVDDENQPVAETAGPQHRITKYSPKQPQACLPAGTKAAELEQRHNKRAAAAKKRRSNNKSNKAKKRGGGGGDLWDQELHPDPVDRDSSTTTLRQSSRRIAAKEAAAKQETGTRGSGGRGRGRSRGGKTATAAQKSMLVTMKRPRAKKSSTDGS